MDFIRRYWVIVLMMVALAASFIADRQSRVEAEKELRKALVTACIADSARTALNASGFIALSERVGQRSNESDQKSAALYRAVSAGVVGLVPAPVGREGDRAIIETKLIDRPGRVPRLVVTEKAKSLQIEGCKAFYGVG